MRSPLNTSAHPLMNHLGALDAHVRTGDSSNFILEQEAAGQRQLVASDVLPTKINSPYGDARKLAKEKLETAGFKFGQVVPRDPLFQEVQLPAGWKKVGTSHDVWSSVVDDKGRERISIFYKAAYYDRDAFMNILEGNWD